MRCARARCGTRHTAGPNARANAPPEQGRITVSAASLMRASRCACKTWPINASSARKVARLLPQRAWGAPCRSMLVHECVHWRRGACASLVRRLCWQCMCSARARRAYYRRGSAAPLPGQGVGALVEPWYRGALVEEPWESPSVPTLCPRKQQQIAAGVGWAASEPQASRQRPRQRARAHGSSTRALLT